MGQHSIDSTNVVGVDVTPYTMFKDNERGGLVMTPLYGDWIRTATTSPEVGSIVPHCQEHPPG